MKKLIFRTSLNIATAVFFLFIINFKSFSQCTNCGDQYPTTTQSTSSTTYQNISTVMYGSDYAICNVVAGETYEWTTCGDTDFDTELTLYEGNKCSPVAQALAYNDDAGGACLNCDAGAACGTQSRIIWTATFTGTVRVLVSEYPCSNNTSSMTLQWRCTTCGGSITPVTASDCSDAVNVCTDLGFSIDANGTGSVLEIPALGTIGNPDNDNPGGSGNDGCLRVGEKNSTWMIVNIASDGLLEFNFGGSDQAGFYDWIMYPYDSTSSCNDIPNNLVAPVRCNWNGASTGGTGLASSVPSGGSASNFEPPLSVTCGEQYIICFSNYSSSATDVPLVFSGTATVDCMDMTCAGNAMCNSSAGDIAYQDCIGAIPVCQDYFCQEYSFVGTGNIPNEITIANSCLGSGEKNDAWYIFTVQQGGDVNFTITPNDLTDDYDWAVYNLTNNSCSDIASVSSLEVSCNYSGDEGPTGPDGSTSSTSQSSAGTPFNDVIPVNTGETYVLNVSNYSATASGYVLDFSASSAVIFDNIPPELSQINSTILCGQTTLNFTFSEQVLCSTVAACDFTVTGPDGTHTVTSVSGSACTLGGTQEATYTVTFTPALTLAGNYNLNLVATCASVEDLCGNVALPGSLPFSLNGIDASVTGTDVLCFGGNSGTATASATGGVAPYTYAWSNSSTGATVTSLTAGTYTVTATSSGGCQDTAMVTIDEPSQMIVTLTPTAETCNGANDGEIEITVSNGTPNYDYSCTGQTNVSNQTSPYTFSGLADGNYTVTVTDDNNCSTITTTNVAQGYIVNATFTYGGNKCYVAPSTMFTFNGTASTSGADSYVWNFDDGNSGTGTTVNHPFSSAGSYDVSLTVTQGICVDVETIEVTVYDNPVADTILTHISCAGFSDGVAVIDVTDGSGIYSYAWSSGGAGTATATGLSAGNYTVTVTDSYGCKDTINFEITEPTALSLTAYRTDATCYDLCDGTASVDVTGGSGSYSYIWTSGGSTSNVSGLCDGVYTVTVTDLNSTAACYDTASVTIDEPAAIILTSSTENAACGLSTGTATVYVTDSNPNYTYNWTWSGGNNNSTTSVDSSTVTLLPSGPVNVTVTNANGCTATTVINVSDDGGPTTSITAHTDILCNGGNNGDATVTVTGGAADFTYTWDGGTTSAATSSTTNTATGLMAGLHTVVVEDANGCTSSSNITLTQPVILTTSTTQTNPNCGQSNGSATVTAFNGTTPYSYSWTGGTTNASIINKPSGTYYVTVTDANNCMAIDTVTLIDLLGIDSLTFVSNDALCYGGSSGSATVTAHGGTPSYSYFWDAGGQITQTAIGLAAGTYNVTVTDLNLCTYTSSVSVGEPTQVTATITDTSDVLCYNGATGTATVAGSGGITPYTYLWSSAAQNTPTATGLSYGVVSVTVTDANNCPASTTVSIDQPQPLVVSATSVDAHCGNADGSATASVSGGISPYSYSWSGGTAPTNQVTITGLSSLGSPYTVTVTDANNCQNTRQISVGDIAAGVATITDLEDVSCFGNCDGEATASCTGTPPFSYAWDSAPQDTLITVTGLCVGAISVTVTDANNCNMIATDNISEASPMVLTLDVEDPACYNEPEGVVTANVSGGTFPYEYQWNDANHSITQSITNIGAGSYIVTVTDANNCTAIDTATIVYPLPIVLSYTTVDANCGQHDGSIDLEVLPAASYTYLWGDGATTQDLDSIRANIYCVTVTNSKDCTADTCIIINNNDAHTISIDDFGHVDCAGNANGYATVTVSGGTGPFSFTWDTSPAIFLPTAVGLSGGTYTVNVADQTTNCVATASIDIEEPTALNYNPYFQDVACFGACDAWARVDAYGGTPPYTYEWFAGNNQADSLNTGLCADDHVVIITDSHDCDIMHTFNIAQPTQMALLITPTDAKCNASTNGSATAEVTGGTSPYSYLWGANAGSQSTPTVGGLGAGNYCLTVTDDHGCIDSLCTVIGEPTVIVITPTITHLSCANDCEGAISTAVSGGTPGYIYSWSGGETSADISGLCADNYSLTVTDANGCTKNITKNVAQPPPLSVGLVVTDEQCYGYCNGSIQANVTGGTTATTSFEIVWSNLDTLTLADSLCPGFYTVTVTDGNGCQKISGDYVDGPQPIVLIISNVTDAICDSANGSATVVPEGGTAGFSIQWDANANYANTFTVNNLAAGPYDVVLTDEHDCTADTTIIINNFGAPTIDSVLVTDILCYGECNGTASIIWSGGTAPVQAFWSANTGSQVGSLASNLCEGQYSVQVKDINNCIVSTFVTIEEPVELQVMVNGHTDVTCNGGNNGTATAYVYGGINTNYTFDWSNGDTLIYADELSAGLYSINVTDENGCEAQDTITISEPPALEILLDTIINVDCWGNATGSITVHGAGGQQLGYDWNWFISATNSPTIGTLVAGSYDVMITDQQDPSCTEMASFEVLQPDRLVVYASSIDATCNETNCDGTVFVSGVQGGVMPIVSYQWSPASCSTGNAQNDTMQFVHTGTYIVQIQDANGCYADTSTYVWHSVPPQIQTPVTQDITCNGYLNGEAIVTARYGVLPCTYTWSPNNGQGVLLNDSTQQIVALMEDNYSITVTDANGCTDNTVFQISEPPVLEVHPYYPLDPICIGQSATISVAVNSGTPPYTYEWGQNLPEQSSHVVSPTEQTFYYVTVTDANGCVKVNGNIHVLVYPAIETSLAISDDEICLGDSVQLFATYTGGHAPYMYTWSDIGIYYADQREIVPSSVGQTYYALTVTDFCGSPSTADTVMVNVLSNPQIDVYVDLESGCAPITVRFENLLHESDYSYNWDFGDYVSGTSNFSNASTPTHEYETPETYDISLTVVDNNGCRESVTYEDLITVHPNPEAEFWADPSTVDVMNADIQFYDQSVLNLVSSTDDIINSWIWQFDDNDMSDLQNPIHTYEYPDTFNVMLAIATNYGCVDTAYGDVVIRQIHTFYVPDAISLESPYKENRYFYPQGIGVDFDEYNLSIYDRWGELIWNTDVFYDANLNPDEKGKWDGTFQNTGRFVELGTYVWYVRLTDINGNDYEYSGTVTVIR